MQYTVCKRMRFAAAHRLREHQGKCADLHGHNYTVEVFIRAPRLNALGMVVDFTIIKNLVGEWLDMNWDHATVLHELDSVSGARKIFTLSDNPTAEVMAEYLFEMLEACLPLGDNDAVVHRVRVWETEDSFAEVEGHE
jgi:6-pyruvoyltetrahydropterin/6-carboxytetrahydropterin synthase